MIESDTVKTIFSERIGGNSFLNDTREYKFARIKRWTQEAKRANEGREVIDLGVGESNEATPEGIVKELQEQALRGENHC